MRLASDLFAQWFLHLSAYDERPDRFSFFRAQAFLADICSGIPLILRTTQTKTTYANT